MIQLAVALEMMATRGQSVTLNWGEDTGIWECSWITSGQRYSAFSKDMRKAVTEAMEKAGVQVP